MVHCQRETVNTFLSRFVGSSERSEGVHSSSAHPSSGSSLPSRQVTSVSRRLVDPGSMQRGCFSTPPCNLDACSPSGFYSQSGEVVLDPVSRSGVCGFEASHQRGRSLTHISQNRPVDYHGARDTRTTRGVGEVAPVPVGTHGIGHKYCTVGKTTSTPDTIVFAGSMETESRSHISRGSSETSATVSLDVVDGSKESRAGEAASDPPSRSFAVHGCLPPGVGRTSGPSPCCRTVVDTEPSSSHQLARIASGFSSPQAVRSRSCRPSCVSQHRQYDGCCLHQQNGGDAFPNIVLPVVGSNDVVHAQAYHASGTAPSGQTEPHCRCAVAQSGGPNNRMGASTGSSQSGFLPLGDTDGGSVCDFCKSQTSDFCLSHSRCSGHGSRRPINVMGRDDRVRVPSVSVDSPRFEQNSEGQRVADIDSADLAKQVVVPSPVGINGRPPDPVAEKFTEKKFSPRSIAVYRTAISSTITRAGGGRILVIIVVCLP